MTPFEKMRRAQKIMMSAEELFYGELIDQMEAQKIQGDKLVATIAELGVALDDLKAKSILEKTEVQTAIAGLQTQVTTVQTELTQLKADVEAGKTADAAALGGLVDKVADIKTSVDDISNLDGATPAPPTGGTGPDQP